MLNRHSKRWSAAFTLLALAGCSDEDDEQGRRGSDAGTGDGAVSSGGTGANAGSGGQAGVAGQAAGGSSGAGGSAGSATGGSSGTATGGSAGSSTGGTATGGTATGGTGGTANAVASYQYSVGKRVLSYQGGTWYNLRYEGDTNRRVFLWSSTNGTDWGNRVRVDDAAAGDAERGALLTWLDNGTPHVGVYWMLRGTTPQEAHFSSSSDQGASFASSATVTADTENAQMNGDVARGDDGSLWAAWTRRVNGSHDGVFYSRSIDDGATWSTTALAGDAGGFGWSHSVAAGFTGEAWIAVAHNDGQLTVFRTATAGSSWQTATAAAGVSGAQTSHPVLRRATNGELLLTYAKRNASDQQTDVFFTRSADGGASWSTPVRVNDDVTTGTSVNTDYYPSLAEGGSGRLYVVWTDDRRGPSAAQGAGNHDAYLSYSVDGGATWSTDSLANDFPEEIFQRQAAVAVAPGTSQDTVVVSWVDNRSGTYQIHSNSRVLP
ncbi:MAG: sialidase family protein [Polyangiaceae bacterium]